MLRSYASSSLHARCTWIGAAFGLAWVALGFHRAAILALCLLAGYGIGLLLERETGPAGSLSDALARAVQRARTAVEKFSLNYATIKGERYVAQRRIR